MDIELKKFDKTLLNDYLHFFDNVAFIDHKDWSECYYAHFHYDKEFVKLWDEGKLERICEDAKNDGYKYIEAYPHPTEKDVYMNHYGPYSMYKKAGFILVKQFEHDCIVRKNLQE